MTIKVYFDGLCQPFNPGGIACYAFIIKENEQVGQYGLAEEPFSINASNNVAEYTGVLKALEWLIKNNYENKNILVRGDSKLVIFQLKGRYKVKAERIINLYKQSIDLICKFNNIGFEWIPREKNKEADALSYKAYLEILDNNPTFRKMASKDMATEKQLEILNKLGIQPQKYLSKMEAHRMISKLAIS
jgi:ribonuclease HI